MNGIDFKNKLKELLFIPAAMQIAKEINVQVYIVGGFVRDMVLGRKKNEIDFLVIGNGLEFASKYSIALGKQDRHLQKFWYGAFQV